MTSPLKHIFLYKHDKTNCLKDNLRDIMKNQANNRNFLYDKVLIVGIFKICTEKKIMVNKTFKIIWV